MSRQAVAQLQGRVRALARQQGRRAGSEANWDHYEFLMSAACPPSSHLLIRGGWIHEAQLTGFGFSAWMEDVDWDLQDPPAPYTGDANDQFLFSGAGQYLPLVVALNFELVDDEYSPYPLFWNPLNVGGYPDASTDAREWVDYATAALAERQVDEWLSDAIAQWGGLVLGAVILRNNGNTTLNWPWQILAIEPVNRGNSYLYRDLRDKHKI